MLFTLPKRPFAGAAAAGVVAAPGVDFATTGTDGGWTGFSSVTIAGTTVAAGLTAAFGNGAGTGDVGPGDGSAGRV